MKNKSLIIISLLVILVVLVGCAPKEKISDTELKTELESLPKEDLEALVEEGSNIKEQSLTGLGARQSTPKIDEFYNKISIKKEVKGEEEPKLKIEEKQIVSYKYEPQQTYNLAAQVLIEKQQEEINKLGQQLAEKQIVIQQPTGKDDQICFPKDICPPPYECGTYPVPISVECGKCHSGDKCLNNRCEKLT
ncbi:MAG: hypothetical protein ABH824_05415 [Nanoarchaeota archaeon]|nr:hypothetical protein [Nanoarchaeota archaeon]MBU1632419.1 hypothetical protein [Nanoarchaeota archaeon]MBU1876319.1 hypothetical protein [Nanoarchaeota archaeon]